MAERLLDVADRQAIAPGMARMTVTGAAVDAAAWLTEGNPVNSSSSVCPQPVRCSNVGILSIWNRDTIRGDLSMEKLRDEYPSGWRILVQNESVGYILDAVMDARPETEYTKSELASDAGVSRQSLYMHLDLLLALEVLEPVADSSPQRYRVHSDSELLTLLHQVNGTVKRHLSD